IALWNTYLPQTTGPCLAVVSVATGRGSCIEPMRDETESLERYIYDFRFAEFNGRRVIVDYGLRGSDGVARKTDHYRELQDGSWQRVKQPIVTANSAARSNRAGSFEVRVREGPNDPPQLVAVDSSSGSSIVL